MGSHAHDDLLRHADAFQGLRLECRDVQVARIGERVIVEIDEGRGEEFHGREALVEIPRGGQLLQQGLRNRLARLGMHREAFQRLGHLQPVLEDLRRQFDEILRHIGAGEPRIAHRLSRPCNAWPNSWNSVLASSKDSSAGSDLGKLQVLTISGVTGRPMFSWSRNELIQAPPRFEDRAK